MPWDQLFVDTIVIGIASLSLQAKGAAMVSAEVGMSAAAIVQAVWMWSTAAAFALFLVAIFSVVGFRHRMRLSRFVLWTALVLLVPVVGPILWFAVGRRGYPAKVEESFTVPPGTPRLN